MLYAQFQVGHLKIGGRRGKRHYPGTELDCLSEASSLQLSRWPGIHKAFHWWPATLLDEALTLSFPVKSVEPHPSIIILAIVI
jgi:hypothetical protein